MKAKKLLLIIDPQNDFVEGGALAVPGGAAALTGLAEYLHTHGDEYAGIAVTVDFHPMNHCSFAPQGGPWPVHCVAHTAGAAIYGELAVALQSLHSAGFDVRIMPKGCRAEAEEYSILAGVGRSALFEFLADHAAVRRLDVCGLAGDVCVRNTVSDLLAVGLPDLHIALLPQYIASIEQATFKAFADAL